MPLVRTLGVPSALLAQLLALELIALWVNRIERKAHGRIERDELLWRSQVHGTLRTLLGGRWPFTWAIAMLAIGNALTLWIGGSLWGITFAFN